ncbi:histidine kinase [Streptomyces sp. NBC_01216]|uniref:sensor histidine kinase n=1 Tax=unclassified Streptomyces TaxID=2593676 RepID=UPI002E0E1CC9|nr:histidine kinase [Streptomyces sp. NBC_01216]
MAPRVAGTITVVVILCFFAVALTYAVDGGFGAAGLALCGLLMLMLLFLQLSHSFPDWIPRAARFRTATLAAQAVLTFAPFTLFGAAWLGMPGFLAASSLLVLRSAVGWAGFAAVIVATGVVQFAVGYDAGHLAYNTVATALTGLVVYGLSRLSGLIREVQAAREELIRLAVTQERLRFARDLHDLLGFSLSTITLKCELAHRLVRVQPERAEMEITEIVQTARQALSDVRSVASSYVRMNLNREVESAASLLRAVGIRTDIRVTQEPLDASVDTVLATVLREGVTNLLRHSKAQNCVIEASVEGDSVRLCISNDGLRDRGADHGPTTGGDVTGGVGLRSLTIRAEALGGTLSCRARPDGWFELGVELPARPTTGGNPVDNASAAATPPTADDAGSDLASADG